MRCDAMKVIESAKKRWVLKSWVKHNSSVEQAYKSTTAQPVESRGSQSCNLESLEGSVEKSIEIDVDFEKNRAFKNIDIQQVRAEKKTTCMLVTSRKGKKVAWFSRALPTYKFTPGYAREARPDTRARAPIFPF